MMNLARILKPRTYGTISQEIGRLDASCLCGFKNHAGMSTMTQNLEAKDRIYADFHVYKGKAALSACPVLPRFIKANSGALMVDRRGSVMLTFSPAIGERKYDWERKQKFALSVAEVGSMINLGPNDSCEFFHDPSKGSSNAGQVRKSLSVKAHGDGSGYFISLNVVDNMKKINERFTVPVTSAEFAVMRTAFSFALPRIMGWDRYVNNVPSQSSVSSLAATPAKVDRQDLVSEWDR